MQRRYRLTFVILLLHATALCRGQEALVRFTLTTRQVADTLLQAGVPTQPTDIALPVPLSSAVPTPHLTITGADHAGARDLRLRVSCTVQNECLPFLVTVDFHDAQRASAAHILLNSRFSAVLPIKVLGTPVVHAGERAVLLLENSHMQVTLPVITIDTGRVGTEVRVASLDRKQTFRGFVVEAGVVHGVLP